MLSTMDNMEQSMSHDCHDEMEGAMEMMSHCELNSEHHETCNELFCGDCAYHSSSATITALDTTITAQDLPLPAFQYLLTDSLSVYSKMIRPPKA